jgi:hypothetical protein
MERTGGRLRHSAGWVSLVVAACANSGQTGSPADGKVPVYETAVPADSMDGGSSAGNDTEPDCAAENNPSERYTPGRFARAVGGYLVVFPRPLELPLLPPWPEQTVSRGLLIYDIGSPTEPRLVGELPLEGTPRQLQVGEGTATLVLTSAVRVDEAEVPEQPMAGSVTRLLRIDWSDPAAPSVVAETTISGDFWQFAETTDGVVVMSAAIEPAATSCTSSMATEDDDDGAAGKTGEYGIETDDDDSSADETEECGIETATVTAYSSKDGRFELERSVDVEGGALRAFVGEGFYAAVAGSRGSTPVLHVVRIGSDGALTELGPIELSNEVTAVALQAPTLLAATATGDGAALKVFDVGTEQPELVGTTALPSEARRFTWSPNGGTVLASGPEASLIDLEDPTRPKATALAGVSEGDLLGSMVVGLGRNDESSTLSITLWDTSSPRSPSQIAELDSDWPYFPADWVIRPWTLDADLGCLAYPTLADDGDGVVTALGVACIEEEKISVLGQVPLEGESIAHPIVAGSSIYGVTERSLQGMSLDGASSALEVGEPIEIYSPTARRVLQERSAGSYRAELVWEDNEFAVALAAKGDSKASFRTVLEHFADGLAVVDDRVVALGLRRYPFCDSVSDDSARTRDGTCPTPNRSGVTVINVADSPHVEARFEIDNSMGLPELPEDVHLSTRWYGYVPLTNGRLFIPVDRFIKCESQAACDEFGLEEGLQTTGYLLVLGDNDGPRLVPGKRLDDALDVEAERWTLSDDGPLDLGRQVLVSGDTLGFVSEQVLLDGSGHPRKDESGRWLVRYWLRRVKVDADDQLEWLDHINTPGAAIALTNSGKIAFSVAPDAEDDSGARTALHRLSLEDGGASIEETLSLGPGYRQSLSVGKRAYVLMGPKDPCASDPTTQFVSVALNEGPLEKALAFEVPFDNWQFAIGEDWWEPGTVVLQGGPVAKRGRLEVDVSASTPELVRYFTTGD